MPAHSQKVTTPIPAQASEKEHSKPITGWDADLISRYDLSGPRYTSYPTALQFHEGFGEEDMEAAIAHSNAIGNPLSLYFHLPFCDTACYYCGCNKVVTHNKRRTMPYLECLNQEMTMLAALFDTQRPVDQLHWGGGTPTFLNEKEMNWLMDTTRRQFNLLNDDSGEYGIEIHPGRVAPSTMRHLRKLGFNRISMGVQDFDRNVQKAVNRYNSVSEVEALVSVLREEKFHSISMDLIYGLPLQTLQSFRTTLERVIELLPDRLSLFNYAHMPQLFKSQRLIKKEELPSAEEKLEILQMAIESLQEAGYVHIGMDHFAQPEDSLVVAQQEGNLQRNFQGYSTHGNCDLLSFGVSSISAFGGSYMQSAKELKQYQQLVETHKLPYQRGYVLSDEDILRKTIIDEIICHYQLDIEALEEKFGINFTRYFPIEIKELGSMQQDGLVELSPGKLQVTDCGRLLVRKVCMVFDAYLKTSNLIRYSKII